MAIIYRTAGAWGVGKGSPLTSAEGDQNNYSIEQRLDAIEQAMANAPVVGIANIAAVGSQMMIYLTDGRTFGPFTLPTAMFRFRDEWAAGAPYAALDLVTVTQQGMFLVNIAHEAVAPFDPTRVDENGNAYYTKVFGESTYIYDVGLFFPGKVGQGIAADGNMLEHLFARNAYLPAALTGSIAKLDFAPADDLDLDITQNGVVIGLLHFDAGTRIGVLSLDDDVQVNFSTGDILAVKRPDVIDSSALGLAVTFAASIA